MTRTEENRALNDIKDEIRAAFHNIYGFSPSKKEIIPLEAGYTKSEVGYYYCNSLGFRVGSIGYSYRMGEGLQKNEAYDA